MFLVYLTSSNEDTKYKMLDFIIPNEVVKKYTWFNDENEDQVFLINKNNDFLFDKSCYKGNELLEIINSSRYYVVSVKLIALDVTRDQEVSADSENKKSEIIIKVEDGKYVKILSNNREDAESFFQNALANNFPVVSINEI